MPTHNHLFSLLFRHGWLLFVVVTCVNGAIWWHRAQPRIAENPALEEGYRRLIRGWLIYGNIPWLVMGAGVLSGSDPSIFYFFNPGNGPFVVAFYGSVVALWIAGFYWIFFRNGAEALITYPGLLNIPTAKPWMVKAYFLLCLAGGIAGLLMMIFGNIQPPSPHRP